MRMVDQLLGEYAESHRNRTNQIIHKICVPAIVYSTLGLMWWAHPWLCLGFIVFSLVWYLRLSWTFAISMLVFSSLSAWSFQYYPPALFGWIMLGIFAVAWVAQFIGHEIEGKKPSFFRDVFFLLVGPLWVLAPVFRKLKIAY